jgi:hypothetical protein
MVNFLKKMQSVTKYCFFFLFSHSAKILTKKIIAPGSSFWQEIQVAWKDMDFSFNRIAVPNDYHSWFQISAVPRTDVWHFFAE